MDMNSHLPTENIQKCTPKKMYNHMKRCTSLVISEMESKPQWNAIFTPLGQE